MQCAPAADDSALQVKKYSAGADRDREHNPEIYSRMQCAPAADDSALQVKNYSVGADRVREHNYTVIPAPTSAGTGLQVTPSPSETPTGM